MVTVIITGLFAVSGFVLLVTEQKKMRERKHRLQLQKVEQEGRKNNLDDGPRFLDFSGGTWGI